MGQLAQIVFKHIIDEKDIFVPFVSQKFLNYRTIGTLTFLLTIILEKTRIFVKFRVLCQLSHTPVPIVPMKQKNHILWDKSHRNFAFFVNHAKIYTKNKSIAVKFFIEFLTTFLIKIRFTEYNDIKII
jgi:hypothetical protein